MKTRLRLFLLILLSTTYTSIGYSQDADLSKTIAAQADFVASGVIRADFDALVKHSHPKLIEFLGGKENYIDLIKETMKKLEAEGVEMLSVEIQDSIQISEFGDDLHCLVPKEVKIRIGEMTLLLRNYLFGMSEDGGKHWVFIEAEELNGPKGKIVLPDFKTNLTIPPGQGPVIVEESKTSGKIEN